MVHHSEFIMGSFFEVEKPNSISGCYSPEHLAIFLGFISYDELSKIIYPSTEGLYWSFYIPKKNGEDRKIDAPRKILKDIQRKIHEELEKIYKPRIPAHGFIKSKSIVSNAEKHIGKRHVLNIDLDDFFGSIHFGRVKNLFSAYPLNLPASVATVLAHICCHNNKLPQGSPASPIISNMIAYKFDNDMKDIASKFRCTYTRYVDDITLSFDHKKNKIPKDIVIFAENNKISAGRVLQDVIDKHGFLIKESKTRMASKDQRQLVTGLVVNDRVNVTRRYIKQTGAMIYAAQKFGFRSCENVHLSKHHKKTITLSQKLMTLVEQGLFFRKIIQGRLDFIKMVRGADDYVYRKLAYQFSVAIGKPDKSLMKRPIDKIIDSIFIIENYIDESQGTGFLLEKIGLITNAHVVEGIDARNQDLLEIYRHDDQENKKTVNFDKSDRAKDLAILKPTVSFNGINRLSCGDDSVLTVGSKITVIGFPQYHPGESPYINSGKIVQQRILYDCKFWLVDIPIIHGNSGGPVLNEKYEVIGIASIGSAAHDQSTKLHGFIPISELIAFNNQPIEK
jgi:RNA-directed DNA polymerase